MGSNVSDRPHYGDPAGLDELTALSGEVTATVRRWLTESAEIPVDTSAARLAEVLKDPRGLPFTVGFVDQVIRPEDSRVAARSLAELAKDLPAFLPAYLRAAIRLGAVTGLALPGMVIPVVRRVLRGMVGHLIVDARERQLGAAIERIRTGGVRLNINLLGEAVLGEREAARRLEGTHRLLARDDVDYVSIKVSATVAPHAPWAFDATVAHVVESLTPLFRRAAQASPAKFINLDMEEYRDLDMTVAVFTALLDRPEFLELEAGIVLQAYLPDALGAMIRLQEWAAARRARGGAGIKVRVVKGANLPMERVEASLHHWPLATWSTKRESDTNYKRLLDYALHPDRIENVRIGVAGHNLFDIAFAWLLAGRREVRAGVEFEMLLGMAQAQAEVVKREVGGLLLYTPVVHPREFDVAIAYLVRRLEEGASDDNFMSAVFDLSSNEALFERERDRFLASLAELDRAVPPPNRRQDRREPAGDEPMAAFDNVPDTDPALPANAAWGAEILERAGSSAVGADLVEAATLRTEEELESVLSGATEAAAKWGALPGAERAAYLRRAAVVLERRRAELLEVMAAEAGKTLDQGDPEISEAIDFANYYATRAEELDRIEGATSRPVRLTVVTPPWNFPVAIPAGSTLAALAAGSAVVIKPAKQARRCGAVMVDALWEAGVPREVLRLVQVSERSLGSRLVSDERVDRLILTGAYETAELFRSFRSDLTLLAETSGKNAIVVTPSADIDLAVKDVVHSAFGHAGQKCSAASLAILVGSVATSKRFRNQLVDAVTSLKVGLPVDATTQMGPLIGPADGKLLRALTTLGPGESWVVEPKRLDEDGRLWSPGVKEGVAPGGEYHLTEYFGPVLGIMTAGTLEQAIELQNQVPYGLTAGLHTLDRDDLALWLDRVQAGNLYVNRGITGAIVRRQPFGGWKKSAVGAGTKAGGPNYLIGLCDWEPASAGTGGAGAETGAARAEGGAAEPETVEPAAGPAGLLAAARTAELEGVEFLERALRGDAAAWRAEFGTRRDVSGIAAERNIFRYVPTPVTIRHEPDSPVIELLRVVAAGVLAGAPTSVSTATEPPAAVRSAIEALDVTVTVEDDTTWHARARKLESGRVRLLGGSATSLYAAIGGRPDIAVYAQPVTAAGRVELLPFLREQAVSITAHRFGTANGLSDGLI
jgi:RHH-type transcriptional regulator, proline utilization regulon repressor / proline dehydrogenase / delta 1-pyrroline-5-carboxylate dehydrogenase